MDKEQELPNKEEDVQEESSTPAESEEGKVEQSKDKGEDKDKNFAELRKKSDTLEKENAELRQKLQSQDTRELSLEDDPEETPKDTLKVIFQRDMKEATRTWNKKNEVSTEEWAQIKRKVNLTGEETQSEIYDKIDEAYNSIPSVREKKEKELIERGKREAMQQFSDEDLDIGSGGDVSFEGGVKPKFNAKTKKWAKELGLSDKELSEVDPDADTTQESILTNEKLGLDPKKYS